LQKILQIFCLGVLLRKTPHWRQRDLNRSVPQKNSKAIALLEKSQRTDDVAPPNGGAVNPSFRQTTRRGVCAGECAGGGGVNGQDVRERNPKSLSLRCKKSYRFFA